MLLLLLGHVPAHIPRVLRVTRADGHGGSDGLSDSLGKFLKWAVLTRNHDKAVQGAAEGEDDVAPPGEGGGGAEVGLQVLVPRAGEARGVDEHVPVKLHLGYGDGGDFSVTNRQ